MNSKNSLVLFDCDLRIKDNPALFNACKNHQQVALLYVLDEKNKRPLGGASKWFLHHILQSFADLLQRKLNLKLVCKKGDVLKILEEISEKNSIDEIYLNSSFEPYNVQLNEKIKIFAEKKSIIFNIFDAQTIFNPNQIKNGSGTYFKVFTPFWKECLKNSDKISESLPEPSFDNLNYDLKIESDNLDLLPKINWADGFKGLWQFDYDKIIDNFNNFISKKVTNYKESRNFPALDSTSKISPYLHFGVISSKLLFLDLIKRERSDGLTHFISEVGWREFSHHLLFHFPQFPEKNFRPEFDNFPWQENKVALKKWQKGQTGFPIIDAGMRELWSTGFMHNRVRMIVASFLIKDLLIDWREGEKWFWDCLVDANLANNTASWQWVAGSGADAAPYFRIFNPSLQSEKFDAEGAYIRKWVPEISKLPNKFLHSPWLADRKTLEYYGVELGKTYPQPMLSHDAARDMALAIFKTLKN
ncbi:MAG: deoxyribodipyrimidine photo-lyase [Pelagibacterales bacterium]|nr:deoxyribodipyrimidine photo-lyase [Pelagibacterales bacterium]